MFFFVVVVIVCYLFQDVEGGKRRLGVGQFDINFGLTNAHTIYGWVISL